MTAPAIRPGKPPISLVPSSGAAFRIRRHVRPGRWSASIRLGSGEHVDLHRTTDPLGEARSQLATCPAHNPRVIAIVGAGLGYLTEAACERFPDARIVVLEPVPALAESARARTPVLYASGRVHLVTGPRFDDGGELWKLFDVEDPEEPDPPLLLNPALQRAVPAPMATAVLLVRRAVTGARMNARARRSFAGRYLVNTLRNLPHIVGGLDPQRLMGQFADVPAVLVAAGPSLDRVLPSLRDLQHRALIIAADTAWRPLLAAGIDPHVVVALDPSSVNARHLAGISPRRDTWLLAEASVDPAALAPFAGRVAAFRVGMHHPWPWLGSLGVQRPLVRVWGSVLTGVFDLSLAFGCNPIVFAGADLAYTDGRPYCRGTSFEHDWARHVASGTGLATVWAHTLAARAAVIEAGVDGRPVQTAAHLVEFRNWLVAHAGRHAFRRIVNATGGGILHGGGIEQATLEATLDTYPDRGDAFRETIGRLFGGRPASVSRQQVMEALEGIEAVTASAQSEATGSPVSEWLEFGRPSLTVNDIHHASVGGRTGVEHLHQPTERTLADSNMAAGAPPALRMHEADRVAHMRARLVRDASPPADTLLREFDRDDGSRCRDLRKEAVRVLDAMFAMPRLIEGPGEIVAGGTSPDQVPLSWRYQWTTAAARWVAALEELLLEAAWPVEDQEERDSESQYWNGRVIPLVPEHAAPVTGVATDDEETARLALTAVLIPHVAADTWDAGRRWQRLAQALVHGARDPRLGLEPAAGYHLEMAAGQTTQRLPLRIDALMRALTGTLASTAIRPDPTGSTGGVWPELRVVPTGAAHGADRRLVFLTHEFDHVEPLLVTGAALRKGYSMATLTGDRALFVPHGSTSSVHILPDGSVESATQWPVAITSEMPWGPDGGALAWNSLDGTVVLKPGRGAEPVIETAPFSPIRATVAPDGTVWWSARGGDVWQWLPGHAGGRVVTAPTWGAIRSEGDDLVLPHLTRDEHGGVVRERASLQWRLQPDTGTLACEPGPDEGPWLSSAAAGQWTAYAHPHADLVGLVGPEGERVVLACYAPTGVAWAGPSLVVGTGDGHVLLFRDLLERLVQSGVRSGAAGD